VDYPYEEMDQSIQFIDSLPISQDDKQKIYFQNADQLGITI
jgi:predicted TIM-barrel fold metal-dependent hydrolase